MDFGDIVTYGALLWLNGLILMLVTLVQGGPFIVASLGIGYTLLERPLRHRSRRGQGKPRSTQRRGRGRKTASEDEPAFTLR